LNAPVTALVARAIPPAAPALMPALGPSSVLASQPSVELSQGSPRRKPWEIEPALKQP
jgi:hypothetical protein